MISFTPCLVMESLSIGLSSSPHFLNHPKTQKPFSNSIFLLPYPIFRTTSCKCSPQETQFSYLKKSPLLTHQSFQNSATRFSNHFRNHVPVLKDPYFFQLLLRSQISLLCVGLSFPLTCFASEVSVPTNEVPNKINLESILVSIDDFFNRNPFFVAGVTFIWLIVIPLTQEYLQKYKFTLAIDAFRKLRDDPNCQLLDIRDKKSLKFMDSPSLKMLNKNVAQVEFVEGKEEDFVKEVLHNFPDPATTVVCILDYFDGNSMKVAELLVKNGFKEAYAVRGGIKGKNGWQEIQDSLLPPAVHVYPRKKVKRSQRLQRENGQPSSDSVRTSGMPSENGYVKNSIETKQRKHDVRSLSPYPNYPDLKPPSSPTPSKPQP